MGIVSLVDENMKFAMDVPPFRNTADAPPLTCVPATKILYRSPEETVTVSVDAPPIAQVTVDIAET